MEERRGIIISTALKHHFFNYYLVWVLCIHVNPTLVDVRDLLLTFTEWHYMNSSVFGQELYGRFLPYQLVLQNARFLKHQNVPRKVRVI